MQTKLQAQTRITLRFIPHVFIVWLVTVVGLFAYQPIIPKTQINHDERIGELTRFMSEHNFAAPYYVSEYIKAADKYGLDYRVLPVISLKESSGCKHYIKENCWGWNSAKTGFNSIPEGIDFVSEKLMNGGPYKGKTLKAKIQTYNSVNPTYWADFERYFNEIQTKED